ncbi:unnamed protein product [Ilex paraguariensis]|uniref:Arf-GAP domain-containing protein n=1 Tax=Ilex paraguariensis TaxID=185542 RepID=A0ABC8S6A8_9AQUA
MARKEDEKNERTIRSLLKLPENRRCINCNSLGPQYVCTNFWTFVCTTCSGIHREFTHRVKSVSMAKFTSQEVSALQGGGNASAKEIYLKEWDAQRNSFPDSSNVERLRDFIKHVYVDRRYTGERSFDKPPRVKMGETDEFNENRKIDSYQGGSRSPPFDDTYERRSSDRPSPGGRSDDRNYRNSNDERSPGYGGDYRRSPARTEIVNDWRRDDRFGNGRRSEDNRISDGGSKLEGRSPDRERDLDMSSPPMVRPVRDILGENVSPLRVIEPPKANGGRSTDGSVHTQRTVSSSSLASSNGNPAELRMESSLIDFDAVPEPSVTTAVPQTAASMSIAQPTVSSNVDNWANFDSAAEVKVSQAPSNANPLESVLLELSVPATVPGYASGIPVTGGGSITAPVGNTSALPLSNSPVVPVGQMPVPPFSSGTPAAGPVNNSMTFFPGGAPAVAPGPVSVLPVNGGSSFVSSGQWPMVQPQQPSFFPAAGNQPTAQPFSPAVGGASSNLPWNLLQGPSSASASQVSQASKPALEVASGGGLQSSAVEVKSSGRTALPEDLFAPNYSSVPGPVSGWQTGPPYGIGFTMQYNFAAPMPTILQSSKSMNPFDINHDPSPVQAPTFPSMASLQGALPSMGAPTGLLRMSSLGTPSSVWMPPQSSHPLAMPAHPPSYASQIPQSPYMGQQVPTNMPPRQQGVSNFGLEGAPFGTLNPNQHLNRLYSAPATPDTFSSVGGNPFG